MENSVQSYQLAVAAGQSVKERKYWLNKLSGHLTKSSFPYDFKKEDVNKHIIEEEKFRFPGILFSKAMKLCGGADVKMHMVLVTTLFILLKKYSGNTDIILGSPLSKQDSQCEFINTVLVFRNKVSNNTNFKELLLEVRETIIQANKHQNYPMERLLERLNIPVTTHEFPLFDVVILLENIYDKCFIKHINYNIGFSFLRTAESIEGEVEYNSLLYREITIKQIIRHYLHVLEQVLADMNRPLSQIQLLPDEERKQVLFDFNNTDTGYPKDKTLHRLFEEQTAKTPDNTALTKTNRYIHLSYKELDEIAAKLAARLKSKGAAPDSIVALMAAPSIEMIIGILGILKAGGAYLPIEPDYPVDRINFMLTDSSVKVLATTGTLAEKAKKVKWDERKKNLEIVLLDFSTLLSSPPSTSTITWQVSPTNLAYIIYTSGTTGRPKGVMVDHKNVVAYVHAFFREFVIKPGDTVIQLASYAFDVSVEELFPILLKGGKIVVPDVFEMMDVYALCRVIAKYRVNIVDCTPLLLNEINLFQANNPAANFLGTVHTFISGGDVLKKEYVNHLIKIGQVYNTYGPTETTVCAAYYRYTPGDNQIRRSLSIPIGSPITNYRIYILDDNHNPVPIGVTGELSVGGPGVTRGYLNQPELTAEKFDRERKKLSGKKNYYMSHMSYTSYIYKTGDLGRWLHDGNIEVSGRKDSQVKIRGYRIETGEIEKQILKNDEIRSSVVITREDKDGDKYLCAYIVSGKEFEPSELRESLRLHMPDYMIPSFFVRIQQIPLTPNGKIDTKALPEPEVIAGEVYVAPQNPIQERMQKLWQMVLGLELIGIYDNFFAIGGHSLKGIKLINEIHKEFDVKFPLAEIFKTPSIEGLSGYLARSGRSKYISIEPVEKKEYYGLSSAQKRLYILQQMESESTAYNMPQVIPLSEEPNIEKMEETFINLIKKHESLKTSFHLVHDEPVQKIHDVVEFKIEYYEKTVIGQEAPPRSPHSTYPTRDIIRHFSSAFDLSQAPLLKVGIIKTDDGKYMSVVVMHHIISDGVSHEVLRKDFMALYEGKVLPLLRIQYKDFSQWQNGEKEMEYLKTQEAYWLKEFEGYLPTLKLATDYNRSEDNNPEGVYQTIVIEKDRLEKLRTLEKSENVTMFMILLALYNTLFFKITGQEDIIIGTVTAGRRHADLENIIGMFVNTLALRNFPRGDMTFRELLRRVKQRTLDAFSNQDYQFEDLVDKVVGKREIGRNPLFDVAFFFNSNRENTSKLDQKKVLDNIQTIFELNLAVWDLKENMACAFGYRKTLFKQETIVRLCGYFEEVVSAVVNNQNTLLKDIILTSNLREAKAHMIKTDEMGFGF